MLNRRGVVRRISWILVVIVLLLFVAIMVKDLRYTGMSTVEFITQADSSTCTPPGVGDDWYLDGLSCSNDTLVTDLGSVNLINGAELYLNYSSLNISTLNISEKESFLQPEQATFFYIPHTYH